MHQIIDNRETKFIDVLKDKLAKSKRARFCIGWFFISGFKNIMKEIDHLEKLEILAGSRTNKQTAEIMMLEQKVEAINEFLNERKYLTEKERQEILDEEFKGLIQEISLMDPTEDNIKFLKWFYDKLQEKKIEIRIYGKEPLHAKLYLFDYGNDSEIKQEAIIGSSNFSLSGLELNTELNVCLSDQDETKFLYSWFDKLWKEGEKTDFTILAQEAIQKSWPFNKEVTPFRLYLKVLHEIFFYVDTGNSENIDFNVELYNFQKDAVIAAKKRLDIFNGVYIADVPGLGKTYIGAALLAHLETEGKNAVVIVPPRLKEMWEEVLRDLGANRAKVFSSGKLEDILNSEKYLSRPIVLIDEAHHFCNPNTKHYQDLTEICRNKQVILLSATPQNLNIWNIYWQIKLFTPYETNHKFRIYPINLREYFKACEKGNANIDDLISQIFIRRTRSDIKEYYPGTDLKTPQREGPKRVNYSIDAVYGGSLYEEIQNKIRQLTYARYNLTKYAIPEKFENDSDFELLKKAWNNLQRLIAINLYRRLESSVKAFKDTVIKYIEINDAFVKIIDKQKIPLGELSDLEEMTEKLKYDEVFEWREGENYLDADKFNVDTLKEDVDKDTKILNEILNLVKDIKPEDDDKLTKLIQILNEEPIKGKKVVIFSYFESTVKYLYDNLKDKFDKVDYIAGGEKLLTKIKRFAPKANKTNIAPEEEIRILITTEVTSEGLNLQDGQAIINYELHWNPVRIIQRIGRIDRINSPYDKIYIYNFFPETKAEKQLSIEKLVTKRIDELIRNFGYDEKTIGLEEKIVRKKLYEIYTETPGSLEETSENTSLNRYFEFQYKKLQEEYRDEYRIALELPPMVSIKKVKNKESDEGIISFCRAEDYFRLLMLDKEGKIINRNDWQILKKMECSPKTKGEEFDTKYFPVIIKAKNIFEEEVNSRERDKEKIIDPVKNNFEVFIDSLKRRKAESIKQGFDEILDIVMNKELDFASQKFLRSIITEYSKKHALTDKEMIIEIKNKLRGIFSKLPEIPHYKARKKYAQIIVAEQIE